MRTASFAALLLLSVHQPLSASPLGFLDRLVPRDRNAAAEPRQAPESQRIPVPEVYFSPKGGCTQALVRELAASKQTILVQAYSFTSTPIAAALVAASRRGVRVEAVLDKSNKTGKYSAADFLVNARIPTWIDGSHAIAHNKVMVIDNSTVVTGSFNFTKAAEESNAENLLILRSPDLAALYTDEFLRHRDHSTPYAGR
jgi:phosphatidylserine/phosphatidylglycerophosphate/cardiolipin synthase-like enzyme